MEYSVHVVDCIRFDLDNAPPPPPSKDKKPNDEEVLAALQLLSALTKPKEQVTNHHPHKPGDLG
jgi:hypothetical protein